MKNIVTKRYLRNDRFRKCETSKSMNSFFKALLIASIASSSCDLQDSAIVVVFG